MENNPMGGENYPLFSQALLTEIINSLTVLRNFLSDEGTPQTPDAATYGELREALISAGINSDCIKKAAEKIQLTNLEVSADRDGALIQVETGEDIREEEQKLVAYTAFFNAILQGIIPVTEDVNKESVEHLQSMIPGKLIMLNDKISNSLTSSSIDGEEYNALVIKKSKKMSEVYTPYILTSIGENDELSDGRLTNFDRAVYDAITTLWVYGDPSHIMTTAMIYRTMTHKTDCEFVSAQMNEEIARSVEKQRRIIMQIDATEELKRRGISGVTPKFNDPYLNVSGYICEAGGSTVISYRLNTAPIRYLYSSLTEQVLTIPGELLDIKEVDEKGNVLLFNVPNNKTRIPIRDYIIRRIEGMKNPKNKLTQNVISLVSYEKDGKHHPGLYEIAGYDKPSKQETKSIRDYAEICLVYWTAMNYIDGYTFTKKGRTISGIEIHLQKKRKSIPAKKTAPNFDYQSPKL